MQQGTGNYRSTATQVSTVLAKQLRVHKAQMQKLATADCNAIYPPPIQSDGADTKSRTPIGNACTLRDMHRTIQANGREPPHRLFRRSGRVPKASQEPLGTSAQEARKRSCRESRLASQDPRQKPHLSEKVIDKASGMELSRQFYAMP